MGKFTLKLLQLLQLMGIQLFCFWILLRKM